jgi:RNA polymerase subunit RPABC4/transcription elongation factor Spt4
MGESFFKIPEVTLFVECPNCHRFLRYGRDKCPSCRELLAADYAHLSAAAVMVNTQAVNSANAIKIVSPAIGIIYFVYFYAYDLISEGLSILSILAVPWSVITLLAILWWFIKYGWLTTIGDADYVKAKREMKVLLWQWLALFVIESIAIALLWLRNTPT